MQVRVSSRTRVKTGIGNKLLSVLIKSLQCGSNRIVFGFCFVNPTMSILARSWLSFDTLRLVKSIFCMLQIGFMVILELCERLPFNAAS